ncbi:MAG: cyclic nucleotide-binding domain-containing protein [Velocimicrobium sp.]
MKLEKLLKQQWTKLDKYHIPEPTKQEAVLLSFAKGEFLCLEGERFPYLLLLIKGKVKVCITEANGKTLLLSFYYPGAVLGDVELMLDGVGTTNVTAITPVTCIGIPMKACKLALNQNLTFMKCTARTIAEKFVTSSKHNTTNMLYTIENRLCAYIEATNENGYFQENLTEIAELLGTSYRHLLRSMASLCEHGVLKKCSRTNYKIVDFYALREKATDCFLNY